MGVPKLFSWLRNSKHLRDSVKRIDSDRYRGKPIEAFYIDGNSLIHPQVSKVNSMGTYENEKEFLIHLFKAIDDEIDRLVKMVQPKHVFEFHMDGVPPQSKIVQQKQRRFLSATEAQMATPKGNQYHFDTNLISPGTDFMFKLDQHLQQRFASFQEADRNYIEAAQYYPDRVVYSSHLQPGEGEHKIAESMKNYPGNKRNAMIYGNDADLIMIFSILLKETRWLNIYLYRTDVDRRTGAPQVFIVDLHAFTVLLECLFPQLRPPRTPINHIEGQRGKKMQGQVNTTVHHFALLSFFLGNDFLPHMPTFQLIYSAIDLLVDQLQAFLRSNPSKHLTDRFNINWDNLQAFLEFIKPGTDDLLTKWAVDPEYTSRLMGKVPHPAAQVSTREVETIAGKKGRSGVLEEFDVNMFRTRWYQWVNLPTPSVAEAAEQTQVPALVRYEASFQGSISLLSEDIEKMSLMFLQGIAWTFHYYVHGMASNNGQWFYPYHYAPLLRDVRQFLNDHAGHMESLVFEALRYTGAPGDSVNPVEHMLMILPRRSVVENEGNIELEIFYDYISVPSKIIADTLPLMVASDWHGAMETYMGAVLCPNPNLQRVKLALTQVVGINYQRYQSVSSSDYRVTGPHSMDKKVTKTREETVFGKEPRMVTEIETVTKTFPRKNKEVYLGKEMFARRHTRIECQPRSETGVQWVQKGQRDQSRRPDTRKPGPDTRKPGPDIRKPGPDIRKPGPDTRKPGPDTRKPGPDTGKPRSDTRKPRPDTGKPRSDTRKPRSDTRKPQGTKPIVSSPFGFSIAVTAPPKEIIDARPRTFHTFRGS